MATLHNKKDKDLFLTLGVMAITLAIGISAWLFYLSQESSIINGMMNSVAKSNEQLVRTMSDQLEENAGNEQEAKEILAAAPSEGISYWSLYAENSLVFEKDERTTELFSGFSQKDLSDYYVRQGGSGAGEFFRLMGEKQGFSILMSKDKRLGNELISASFVQIGDKSYCVTTSILQSYLLSTGRIGETLQYIRILVAGILLVSSSAILYFSVLRRRNALKIQALADELKSKNILVQEQGDRLFTDENDDLTIDIRTGLYANAFFEVVMEQLSEREDLRVGFLYFRIDNISELYGKVGYQGVSALLHDAAEVLLTNTSERDIAARVGSAEFVILCFDTTAESIYRLSRKIAVSLAELNSYASFSYGNEYMSEGEKPAQAYEKARKAAKSK